MIYREKQPGLNLAPFINKLFYTRARLHYKKEKIFLMPVIHLIFNLGEPYKLFLDNSQKKYRLVTGGFIAGINEYPIVIENPYISHNIGVEFKPFGFYPFTNVSMFTYKNAVVDSTILLPGSAVLLQQLRGEEVITKKFTLIENYLTELLLSYEKSDTAIVQKIVLLLEENPDVSLAQISGHIGYSSKHIISLVKKYTGHTPKTLAMIYKFQKLIHKLHTMETPDWSGLAADANYYDQADFVKKFKQFTGFLPTEYVGLIKKYNSGEINFAAMDSR